MSGIASYKNVVGVAKEVTVGTPVAATDFIPVTAPKFAAKPHFAGDTAWRGSMVTSYDQILGVVHGEIDFGGPAYADSLGWLLQHMLPDIATTGTGDPYTSVFSALNSGQGQPKTSTFTSFDGAQTLQYPGAKLSDLTIKYTADGLVEHSVKGMSLAPVVTTAPTATYSAVRAFAGWSAAVLIGGTARTSNILLDAEIDFKRTVTVVEGITGTATPIAIWSGPLDVTGKLTFVYDDGTDYLNMINNTAPSLSIVLKSGTGTAAGDTQIGFQMTKCAYTDATPDPGADYMKMSVAFIARANTTDAGASGGYSPIKATLINAKASGTYA